MKEKEEWNELMDVEAGVEFLQLFFTTQYRRRFAPSRTKRIIPLPRETSD